MINVSNAFKQELYLDHRNYLEYADITLSGDQTLNLTNKDFWQGGVSLDDAVSGNDAFEIGSAIVNSCSLTIENLDDRFSEYDFLDAKIVIYIGLNLPDGTIERVRKGTYTVNEPKYNGATISLNCQDNMARFDRTYSESKLTYPATLGSIVQDACSVCGVSLQTPTFPHNDFIVQTRPMDEAVTFREVISWAAQIAGCFCRCDVQGRLELKWYNQQLLEKHGYDGGIFDKVSSTRYTTGDNVDGGIFNPWNVGDVADGGTFEELEGIHHIYSHYSSPVISTDDVVITGVRVLEKAKEQDEETGSEKDVIITYQSGSDGYVVSIEDNELIQGGAGREISNWLGQQLIGFRFRKASLSHASDPTIEAGDIAIVTDRKRNTYPIIVSSTRFSTGSAQSTESSAETPARNSAARFSATTKNYVEYRKDIEKERTEREKAQEELKERIDSSSGLYTTEQTQPDGSTIFYMHDKPTLEESKIVWKMTAEAWGVSTDGGGTYNAGMTVDGDVIARILTATGINADWIKTGALRIEKNGKVIFLADADTKQVKIVADEFSLSSGDTIDSIADSKAGKALTDAKAYADSAASGAVNAQTQESIFNKLTNNGNAKGIILKNGQLYVSATYMQTGAIKVAKNGKTIFLADMDAGKVEIVADSFSLSNGDTINSIAESKAQSAVNGQTQEDIFNKLTKNSTLKGLYMSGGELYMNASYIKTGTFKVSKGTQTTFSANADTGEVNIVATSFSLTSGKTIDSIAQDKATTAQNNAKNYTDSKASSTLTDAKNYADSTAASKAKDAVNAQTQKDIFNRLTNNGANQGIFLKEGKIYLNAEYLDVSYLSAISADLGTVTSGKMQSSNYSYSSGYFSSTGMLIDFTNRLIRTPQFSIDSNGNARFKGTLDAAGGTFSGNLSAAGGTFKGSLSAATGTFSGSLSAATGTFSGTLSAATGSFSGSVTATSGEIGPWVINEQAIYNGIPYTGRKNSNSTGIGDYGTDWAFWAGNGRFSVKQDGTLYAESGTFKGTITGSTITGSSLTSNADSSQNYISIKYAGIQFMSNTGSRFGDVSALYGFLSYGVSDPNGSTTPSGAKLEITSPTCVVLGGGNKSLLELYGGNTSKFYSNVIVTGSHTVRGTKSRLVSTENYSERTLNAYEMPAPMFGDIGEAATDENGECYIFLDDIFSETVSAQIEYQVFLQKEGSGDVWVDSKEPAFFVVKGTPNLKFAWEIKAKQKDYEYERLETYTKEDTEEIDYEQQYLEELELLIREQEEMYS